MDHMKEDTIQPMDSMDHIERDMDIIMDQVDVISKLTHASTKLRTSYQLGVVEITIKF